MPSSTTNTFRSSTRSFKVAASQTGTAFVPVQRLDLDRVFAIQHERMVDKDNTVRWANMHLQIEPQQWRSTLAGCRVMIYEHLDDTLTLGYGPHVVGRFNRAGVPLQIQEAKKKRGKRNWPRKSGGQFLSNTVTSAARSAPR
jgi:hypothetical protein